MKWRTATLLLATCAMAFKDFDAMASCPFPEGASLPAEMEFVRRLQEERKGASRNQAPTKVGLADGTSLCVVMRTYTRYEDKVPCAVDSLLRGARLDHSASLRILLVGYEVGDEEHHAWLKRFEEYANLREKAMDPETRSRVQHFAVPDTGKDRFGWRATNYTINWIAQNNVCNYTMVTNGDNYYLPDFWGYVLPTMREKHPFITFEFITRNEIALRLPTNIISTEIEFKRVDLGTVILNTAALAATRVSMYRDDLDSKNLEARDFSFYLEVLNAMGLKNGDVHKIYRVLFVHQ